MIKSHKFFGEHKNMSVFKYSLNCNILLFIYCIKYYEFTSNRRRILTKPIAMLNWP